MGAFLYFRAHVRRIRPRRRVRGLNGVSRTYIIFLPYTFYFTIFFAAVPAVTTKTPCAGTAIASPAIPAAT